MKMYNYIKSVRHFCLAATLSMFALPMQAQESMMQDISYPYLEQLIATAKANYPKVKTYDTRIDIARAGINRTKMSYFDVLSFSYLYNPNNGVVNPNISTNYMFGYQFGAFVNIGGILQKPAMVRQARGEEKLAHQEKAGYELSIEAEVQQRYFLYVQEMAVLRLRAQTLLDAETMLKNSRYRFEKGEETLDNYTKVLIVYADHQAERIKAEASVLIAKSSLEELLGAKLETIR